MTWISVKNRCAPSMETVILFYEGRVTVGWNESTQPEEDPSYYAWELGMLENQGVTHWMPLPRGPSD